MTTQHDLIPGLRAGLLEKVREVQRLMSNLTTGPWKVGEIGEGWMVADFGHGTDDEQSLVITDCVRASELDGNPRRDAEFLVWARNYLPALLREVATMVSEKSVEAISPQAWKERAEKAEARIAELEAEVARLREALEEVRDKFTRTFPAGEDACVEGFVEWLWSKCAAPAAKE